MSGGEQNSKVSFIGVILTLCSQHLLDRDTLKQKKLVCRLSNTLYFSLS